MRLEFEKFLYLWNDYTNVLKVIFFSSSASAGDGESFENQESCGVLKWLQLDSNLEPLSS